MSGDRKTPVSVTCAVSPSRWICTGSRVINRQCLSRRRARQQGLHEADAPQPQLRGLGPPRPVGPERCGAELIPTALGTSWRGRASGTLPSPDVGQVPPSALETRLPSATPTPSWGQPVRVGVEATPDSWPTYLCSGLVHQTDVLSRSSLCPCRLWTDGRQPLLAGLRVQGLEGLGKPRELLRQHLAQTDPRPITRNKG